jgi:glutathione S-transferase
MAGYQPEVVKVRGLGVGPRFLHLVTSGRREVEELSGQRGVPVLVADDGEVVVDSRRIIEWAEAHPAP